MKRILTSAALALLVLPVLVHAQDLSVRRMSMGGVVLGGRQGGEGANVAYRGVPRTVRGPSGYSLPIGVLQVLNDPPSLDPRNPEFNVFELANLVENPPWNLALTQPHVPSSDVTLDVSQNALHLDLGDLGPAFPRGDVRFWGVTNGPTMGFSVRRVFVALAPLVEFDNTLRLNEALSGVLRDGDSIGPNQRYEAVDVGHAQAAAALHLGTAFPLFRSGEGSRLPSALYVGARAKVIRGLAYGEAHNIAGTTTSDTLFGSSSLDLGYDGHWRDAGPADGGFGLGFDAGTVWTLGSFELGLAVNDLGTRIPWRVRETLAHRDSASGDLVTTTVATGQSITSEVPSTVIANAAWHGRRWMAAADVRQNPLATTAHAGLERWVGPLALRAGVERDTNRRTQLSGGVGVRVGAVGLDVAVATHNRNLENERMVELGAGLSLYH